MPPSSIRAPDPWRFPLPNRCGRWGGVGAFGADEKDRRATTRERRDPSGDSGRALTSKTGMPGPRALVDEVLAGPAAGEGHETGREALEERVVAPEGRGAAVGVPVGPEHHLVHRITVGPARGEALRARPAAVQPRHVGGRSLTRPSALQMAWTLPASLARCARARNHRDRHLIGISI